MKIIIAPDKYKSNMDSLTVCDVIQKAFHKVSSEYETVILPMADGGEGTVDAIVSATHGKICEVVVSGPFGKPVTARYGIFRDGKSAVMEMSSASGIALVSPNELNPMTASTYGTGELILEILRHGVEEIIIGIGGSATVDGGAGMAQALGFRLLDDTGKELPRGGGSLIHLQSIDSSGVSPLLKNVSIRVACDVTSPLLGKTGSAAVFGPQKGATPEMVLRLEEGLSKLAEVWKKQNMLARVDMPGDGAAGGLGAGLKAFCNAVPESGAELVMKALDFRSQLSGADLVITGEGKTDAQTSSGKICAKIAETSHEQGVPVMLISGSLEGDLDSFLQIFDYAFSTSSGHISLEATLKNGKRDLQFTCENIAKLLMRNR